MASFTLKKIHKLKLCDKVIFLKLKENVRKDFYLKEGYPNTLVIKSKSKTKQFYKNIYKKTLELLQINDFDLLLLNINEKNLNDFYDEFIVDNSFLNEDIIYVNNDYVSNDILNCFSKNKKHAYVINKKFNQFIILQDATISNNIINNKLSISYSSKNISKFYFTSEELFLIPENSHIYNLLLGDKLDSNKLLDQIDVKDNTFVTCKLPFNNNFVSLFFLKRGNYYNYFLPEKRNEVIYYLSKNNLLLFLKKLEKLQGNYHSYNEELNSILNYNLEQEDLNIEKIKKDLAEYQASIFDFLTKDNYFMQKQLVAMNNINNFCYFKNAKEDKELNNIFENDPRHKLINEFNLDLFFEIEKKICIIKTINAIIINYEYYILNNLNNKDNYSNIYGKSKKYFQKILVEIETNNYNSSLSNIFISNSQDIKSNKNRVKSFFNKYIDIFEQLENYDI